MHYEENAVMVFVVEPYPNQLLISYSFFIFALLNLTHLTELIKLFWRIWIWESRIMSIIAIKQIKLYMIAADIQSKPFV